LYKYNEQEPTPENINKAINVIKNAQRKAYYIEQVSSKKKNKDLASTYKNVWTYKLIETEPNVVD
jgi:ABC-type Zn uptake system ZnuABC Zn-binding protein ZnuA